LADFTEQGLRHRDLRPDAILLRTREPLDLVVTDFGSARLSDFDLEAVAPLQLTRYAAPEAIVGTVSAASDWWSLGMILLEQATAGGCFQGVNEQAFRLHVVTRGIDIPAGIDADVRVLLRGLLARDPLKRWGASQLFAWLMGELVSAEETPEPLIESGPAIELNERGYTSPDLFSLAAAGAELGRRAPPVGRETSSLEASKRPSFWPSPASGCDCGQARFSSLRTRQKGTQMSA
jgi:primosomal replication protein N''